MKPIAIQDIFRLNRKVCIIICAILSGTGASAQINHFVINDTIYAPGSLEYDLDQDGNVDFTFEINLLEMGEFATRVVTGNGASFLDETTFGYPDTLNYGDNIDGIWNNGNGVLGTFHEEGKFKGAGDKYLGVLFGGFTGWIELNSSATNDTLIIISAGYTDTETGIFAGQTEPLSTSHQGLSERTINIFPNPASGSIQIHVENIQAGMTTRIYSVEGLMMYSDNFKPLIDISQFVNGIYFIILDDGKNVRMGKFVVAR